jgi:hypothetical protein
VPDATLLLLASGWRERAQELLLRSETMSNPAARIKMREIAACYERLAQQVEQRSFGRSHVTTGRRG